MEKQESERNQSQRSVRNIDRQIKDFNAEIERKEKRCTQLQEENQRAREKLEKLLQTIEELQSSESGHEHAARRAEREVSPRNLSQHPETNSDHEQQLREERTRVLQLEKEMETFKTRGFQKGVKGSGSWRPGSEWSGGDDGNGAGLVIPKRVSSIVRTPSLSKGFL